ncbi:hypothetical protein [Ancrocorticia populi]|uniref:hypothetical protein n=1 Tax=Ancrocorticia populi TaxID=2175228 RepID=UPI0014037A45|nr:hypothetical protein [Ancrocorticia populi]
MISQETPLRTAVWWTPASTGRHGHSSGMSPPAEFGHHVPDLHVLFSRVRDLIRKIRR